jgi:hypothetical protein
MFLRSLEWDKESETRHWPEKQKAQKRESGNKKKYFGRDKTRTVKKMGSKISRPGRIQESSSSLHLFDPIFLTQ